MLVRNPFFKKIESADSFDKKASYKGIALKSLWYWVICAIGMVLYYFMPLPTEITSTLIVVIIAAVIIAVMCPIIAYFFPLTCIVTGTLYSIVQGFLLAMVCETFLAEYGNLLYVAILCTILIFILMLCLYTFNIIKVNHKFQAVIFTLFIASIILSAIVFISSFFTPVLKNIFINNPLSIIVSIIALLIAAISLVFEFDFAKTIVVTEAKKKYEWVAGYGLFMTVILIFLRIIELISKIAPNENKD